MSAHKPTSPLSAETLAQYETLVATTPGLERQGAAMPCTALNGHMFSYLTPDGQLALRLPPEARAAFLARYPPPPDRPAGVRQPEYIYVPLALLADTAALQPYFAQSVAYARSLKAKPTTRPTAAKASSPASRRRAVAKRARANEKKKRLSLRR